MDAIIPPVLVAVLAALVALAAAGLAGFLARRAWPIELEKVLRAQADRVRAAEAIAEGVQTAFTALKAANAAWLAEAEDVLESVERRRARIAASESKAKAREERQAGLPEQPMDPGTARAAVLARGRAMGIRTS